MKENNKSKKNKKDQSDLIRSLFIKLVESLYKSVIKSTMEKNNMKHTRNGKMY